MAFASVGSLGSANSKVSGTSVSLTTSATAEAGNLVVVAFSSDNISTSDAETSDLAVSDSVGNVYEKAAEWTNAEGAAGNGVTIGVFRSVLATELPSGGTITGTIDSAVTAKAISAWEFTSGGSVSVATYAVNSSDGGDPASMTLAGLPSKQYLLFAGVGREGPSTDTFTQDADYTSIASTGTTGSSPAGNISVAGGFRIATLTGDTYDASGTNRDYAQALVALVETTGVSASTDAVHRPSLAQRQANLVKRVGAVHTPSVSLVSILGSESESWYNHATAFYNDEAYYDHTANTAQRTSGGQPFRPYGQFSGRGVIQGSVSADTDAVHRPSLQRQANLFFSVTRSFVINLPTRFVGLFTRQWPTSQPGQRYGNFSRAGGAQVSVAVQARHAPTVQRQGNLIETTDAVHITPLIGKLIQAVSLTALVTAVHRVTAARLSPVALDFNVIKSHILSLQRQANLVKAAASPHIPSVVRRAQLQLRAFHRGLVSVAKMAVRTVVGSVTAKHLVSVQRQANLALSTAVVRVVSVVVTLSGSLANLAFTVVAVHAASLQRQGNLIASTIAQRTLSLQRQGNLFFTLIRDIVVTAARQAVRPVSLTVTAVHLAARALTIIPGANFSVIAVHAASLQRQANLFLGIIARKIVDATATATAAAITLAFQVIVKHLPSLQRQANLPRSVINATELVLVRFTTFATLAVTAVHLVSVLVTKNAFAVVASVARRVEVRVSVWFRSGAPKFTGFPGIGLWLGRRKQWTRRK